MSIIISIPSVLQNLTNDQPSVSVEAETVQEAIDNLIDQYQHLEKRLKDDEGNLRRFINVYVNDEDIRLLDSLKTKLGNHAHISIIPAIAGG